MRPVSHIAGLGSLAEKRFHAASLASSKGVPLEKVSRAVGHASIRTTERHYLHDVEPSVGMEARKAMAKLFGGSAQPKRQRRRTS